MFYYIEYNDLLNPVNEKQLFALHYVFFPCSYKAIEDFKNVWNHHGVRTERGMTPNQLLTMGMLQLRILNWWQWTLWQLEDGLVTREDNEGVEVPRSTIQLSEQLSELQEALADSEDYGISIYTRTLQCLDNFMVWQWNAH